MQWDDRARRRRGRVSLTPAIGAPLSVQPFASSFAVFAALRTLNGAFQVHRRALSAVWVG